MASTVDPTRDGSDNAPVNSLSLQRIIFFSVFACFVIALVSAQNPSLPKQNTRTVIENPSALAIFFEALSEVRSGRRIEPVRIMHFGDSHVAADILTGEIRQRLQNEFGDGGAGYVVPANPMATRRRGGVSGATSGWQIEGIGGRMERDNIYGLAGINLITNRANERIWLESQANHFEMFYVREPGGGSVDVTLDGATVLDAPLSLAAHTTATEVFSFDSPAAVNHRLEIRTLKAAKTRILGIVAERIAPGVSYDVLGINGARISRIMTWNAATFAAELGQRKPELIVLAYGTNEIADADWNAMSYRRLLKTIIERIRSAAPQAPILLFAPPDRGDLPLAAARMPAMIEAQRRVAFEAGVAFWSAFDAMGGSGSMDAWVARGWGQNDRVHLTRQGYHLLADAFCKDLMRAFDERNRNSR
ncbi:MAG TPA: GDSL-type esterase/lipase family protein [Pyrinomonadaceae bacterium]|nr:GDSL-type esterase/lipase family protein [Pyrinomonadaceae bacterium]